MAHSRPTWCGTATGALLLSLLLLLLTAMQLTVVAATAQTGPRSTTPVVKTVQLANLNGDTRSLTFLSSGYQSEATFNADVERAIGILYNNSDGVVSDPWPRYASLFNVYSVYEASVEPGAGRPQAKVHDCSYMNNCTGPADVKNNLGCRFGTPNPHLIACDIAAVQEMAARAPAEDVAVVLVNESEASGVATDGIAIITNDETFMGFLLVHYLNRALAGLQEEYSLGFQEVTDTERYAAPNCAVSPDSTTSEVWSYWRTYGSPLLPTTPALGCTFSNYYAPSSDLCLMRNSSINVMCPVCRERLVNAFYESGVENSVLHLPSTAKLNLVASRMPPEDYVLYVDPQTEALALSIGTFLDDGAPGKSVKWYSETNELLASDTAVLYVPSIESWTLPATVTAVVQDASPFVREPTAKNFYTNTTFQIRSKATLVGGGCPSAAPFVSAALADLFSVYGNTSLCAGCANGREVTTNVACGTVAGAMISPRSTPGEDTPVYNPTVPTYNTTHLIIVAAVCGGVVLLAVLVTVLVYLCVVRYRPREVLLLLPRDTATFAGALFLCVLVMVYGVLAEVFTVYYIPLEFVFSDPFSIGMYALGGVVVVVAFLHFCSLLFRWVVLGVFCLVLEVVLGLASLAGGAFAVWFHFNVYSEKVDSILFSLWRRAVKTSRGNELLCELQQHMQCSGYHAGCFMTPSSECPSSCASNVYVDACQVHFTAFAGEKFLPVGILALVGGILLLLAMAVGAMYLLRFRQLSRSGQLRRNYRTSPHPPVVPITYEEADKARVGFNSVCRKPEMTLEGKPAVDFLEKTFGTSLTDEEEEMILKSGPLTFDGLLSGYFPYMDSTATDPRLVTAGEADNAENMVDLEKLQEKKLEAFAEAAGTLSPEALHVLFQRFSNRRFMPNSEELLAAIRSEAARDTEDRPFCQGLSPMELEGLRGVWVSLHPKIVGSLTDEQLSTFYTWSHGAPASSQEVLRTWKRQLDVRDRGSVGWAEFCYPYAQQARLLAAREVLRQQGKDVPPELIARATVVGRYGQTVVEACFMPNETLIPMERLVAFLLEKKQRAVRAI